MAYMSQEGYDKLVAELKQLESIERPKASAAIAEARDKGDLSENSEYDAAKEAQAHLEDKINKLKVAINEAKIVEIISSIRMIIQNTKIPPCINNKICKKCAYFDLCMI